MDEREVTQNTSHKPLKHFPELTAYKLNNLLFIFLYLEENENQYSWWDGSALTFHGIFQNYLHNKLLIFQFDMTSIFINYYPINNAINVWVLNQKSVRVDGYSDFGGRKILEGVE